MHWLWLFISVCMHACIYICIFAVFTVTFFPEVFPFDFSFLDPVLFFPDDLKWYAVLSLSKWWIECFCSETRQIHSKVRKTQIQVYCYLFYQEKRHCFHPAFVYKNNNDGPLHSPIHVYIMYKCLYETQELRCPS